MPLTIRRAALSDPWATLPSVIAAVEELMEQRRNRRYRDRMLVRRINAYHLDSRKPW